MASFQFSQGGEGLQWSIIAYFKCLHPELTLTQGERARLQQQLLRPASIIAYDVHRHPVLRKHGEGEGDLITMNRLFSVVEKTLAESPENKEMLVYRIAQQIVQRDFHWLISRGGRRYQSDATRHFNPYKDAWRSDLCYFGFLGHTTGLPDLDQLFGNVAAYWREHWYDEDQQAAQMQLVVKKFNQKHREQPGFKVHAPHHLMLGYRLRLALRGGLSVAARFPERRPTWSETQAPGEQPNVDISPD